MCRYIQREQRDRPRIERRLSVLGDQLAKRFGATTRPRQKDAGIGAHARSQDATLKQDGVPRNNPRVQRWTPRRQPGIVWVKSTGRFERGTGPPTQAPRADPPTRFASFGFWRVRGNSQNIRKSKSPKCPKHQIPEKHL